MSAAISVPRAGRGKQPKPKSRTGCTTCKIRKIKCDETKPACKKCISTGRKCDGYAVIQQYQARQDTTALSKREASLGSILGTTNEKRFFVLFQTATQAGVAFDPSPTWSFWGSLAPRLAHHSEAVKNAAIALGATYHLFKIVREPPLAKRQAKDDTQRSQLESFVARHYNMAIYKLNEVIASDAPEALISALTCCLIFVAIEHLRSNHRAAALHITSGAAIMDKSFDVVGLASRSPKYENRPVSPLVSNQELKNMIEMFRKIEHTQHLFARDIPVTLTARLYSLSRLDSGSDIPQVIDNIEEGRKAVADLVNDFLGYDQATQTLRKEPGFWTSRVVSQRYRVLVERADSILEAYKAFMMSNKAPRPATRERAGIYHDMLQTATVRGTVMTMPFPSLADIKETDAMSEAVYYAEKLLLEKKAISKIVNSPLGYMVEPVVAIGLYYGFIFSPNPETKAKALSMFRENVIQEGPWDGRSLSQLLSLFNDMEGDWKSVAQRWWSDIDCATLLSTMIIDD
ncbi:hypothetical protein B0I35DRAFT_64431 [Stachybotrys elegans]|uniref:Zn(2)-C6 fungal-type domain-containing protein n=1 Tax=Stachybotrys elegans TaxID=80388 RepID=A0A8K0WPP8_9HYPO|nr:hypothetical protein B0I35DRAFT_64431 [Stachybotrys elegans]